MAFNMEIRQLVSHTCYLSQNISNWNQTIRSLQGLLIRVRFVKRLEWLNGMNEMVSNGITKKTYLNIYRCYPSDKRTTNLHIIYDCNQNRYPKYRLLQPFFEMSSIFWFLIQREIQRTPLKTLSLRVMRSTGSKIRAS